MSSQMSHSLLWNTKPSNPSTLKIKRIKMSRSMMNLDCSDNEARSSARSSSHGAAVVRSPPASSATAQRSSTAGPTPSSKNRKRKIAPVMPPKPCTPYELFGTDSEDEVEESPARKQVESDVAPQKITSHRNKNPVKKMKHSLDVSAASTSKKLSAKDVFGSDSEDDGMDLSFNNKKAPPMYSYISKRIPNGVSRQSDENKTGSHFIELKVYNCDEIKNVQPMNRWRHAIITIKNKTDDNTEAWNHLCEFIKATRREFKDCRPDIIRGC